MPELSIHKSSKTAILYGIHTALAKDCLNRLVGHKAYSSIIVLGHKNTKIGHTKVQLLSLDDSQLEELQDKVVGSDLFIFQDFHFDSDSTSAESFIQANYILPLRIAIYAKKNNVNQVHLVTGASTVLKSVFMPHKAKEELEQSIRSLEFWSCYVYKPINVLNQSTNLRETVSSFLMNRMNKMSDGLLNKFVPIDPLIFVNIIIENAQLLEKGVHVLKNEDICIKQNELK